jgi:hypothetical protein
MLLAIVLAAVAVWVAIAVTTSSTRKVAAQDDLLAHT